MEPSSSSSSSHNSPSSRPQPQGGWLATKYHQFHVAHERVKHTVHTAWRVPLPPWGRFAMGCVYFSIPVVLGYYAGTWAITQSEMTQHERLGDGGNDSKHKIQGIGDKMIIPVDSGSGGNDTNTEQSTTTPTTMTTQIVGAGGWGGGVNLAKSDQETQDINRVNLERFMKKQLREKKKREREAKLKEKGMQN